MSIRFRPLPTWSDARIDELAALWANGLGQSEIARRMQMSRSAVIAKVARLIEAGILIARASITRSKPPAPVRTGERRASRFPARFTEGVVANEAGPEILEPLLFDGKPVTIRTCTTQQCQFMNGEPSIDEPMCGRPVILETRWCIDHARRCFAPQQDRNARQRQAENAARGAG